MNYTKPMIELVYEIRRMVPSELKPGVKMANPELFDELALHYHSGAKTITKALIKELLFLAGDPWRALLDTPKTSTPNVKPHNAKTYRGIVSLEEKRSAGIEKSDMALAHAGSEDDSKNETAAPKRVYRGQVIA
ncbi:hypothetical protein TDB9533_01049 [Thalassocella blandensis]|nr:hypothetical protein TDB9533_01049 [Thalassocella blandensis]